jgi:transposase InsO family protein
VLQNRLRKDEGEHRSLSLALREAIRAQYREHASWSCRLHYDNLAVRAEKELSWGALPSYSVVRRWMRSQALYRQRKKRPTPGGAWAEARLLHAEVRSYEAAYVMGLWHADFHAGSRQVLTRSGAWATPQLFGALDDKSRLACHVQWYLAEFAETFAHGFSQAAQKRGLPWGILTDNGGAETAHEIEQGFSDLGVLHERTLPESPYQNGKQEAFWRGIEGRLLPMLDGVKDLTLDLLNEATQAWVELEYNHAYHSEIQTTPLRRFLEEKSVGRPSPGSEDFRRAFRLHAQRAQRRNDGTITVEGVRFEVPNRFRHLERLSVRFARWDLSAIDLVDPRDARKILCPLYPLNKTQNADGQRRRLDPIGEASAEEAGSASGASGGVAPLLRKLLAAYAATGLPPAYLPQEETP